MAIQCAGWQLRRGGAALPLNFWLLCRDLVPAAPHYTAPGFWQRGALPACACPGCGVRQPPPAPSSCPVLQQDGRWQIAKKKPGLSAEIPQTYICYSLSNFWGMPHLISTSLFNLKLVKTGMEGK